MVRTLLAPLVLLTACAVFVSAQERSNKDLFKEYLEKFGPPGPEHKNFDPLVGRWHAQVKMWHEPGQSPHESEGTLTRKSIFDGRFVQEHFEGKIMDQPYHGMGTMGYDRAKRKYFTTWADSMSTAMHVSRGDYDPATQTWTFAHEDKCPITGQHVKMRDTLRIVTPDEELLTMYKQMGSEKEMKTMEIRLTRQK